MATTQVIVLGGGYAGQMAAARLATRRPDVRVTVIDASGDFVERIRLHEAAAGRRLARRPMASMLPRGVAFVHGRVVGWDPAGRVVDVETDGGPPRLAYDACVYALGSRVDVDRVPGVATHAHVLDGPASAARAAAAIARGRRLVVVGGGLTGLEAATELAERHRACAVTLLAAGPLGGDLARRAAEHVRAAFAGLGIVVREHARVVALERDAAVLAGGERVPFDACLWSGGFVAAPLARAAGVPLDGLGRIRVDATLAVPGVPQAFAVGDAAAVAGPDGASLRMACATAMPMGVHAAENVVRQLAGEAPRPFRFAYAIRCVSLGRRDGLVQHVDETDRPVERVWTGRRGAAVKALVCRSTVFAVRAESRAGLPLYRWPRPRDGRAPLPAPVGAGE